MFQNASFVLTNCNNDDHPFRWTTIGNKSLANRTPKEQTSFCVCVLLQINNGDPCRVTIVVIIIARLKTPAAGIIAGRYKNSGMELCVCTRASSVPCSGCHRVCTFHLVARQEVFMTGVRPSVDSIT
jgi:hypothetical protein